MPTLRDYLEYKRGKLAKLAEHLRQSDAPAIPLSVTARVAGGSGVRPVQIREFVVVTDSGDGLAGYNLGPTSPELLLTSLASCLAHTFLIVAVQRGITYDRLEVTVDGDIDFRGILEIEGAPDIAPHNLRYTAHIASPASDEELAQVQQEVERLCPVFLAITRPMAVAGSVTRAGG